MEDHLNNSYKNIISRIKNYIKSYFLHITIIAMILLINIVILNYPVGLILTDSQSLYLSSVNGQIIATIFGLTITGYIFFEEKLDEYVRRDDTYEDIIDVMEKHYRSNIFFIAMYSMIEIVLCVFNIVSDSNIYLIIINILIFFVVSLIFILKFIFDVIDPDKIKKISKIEKEKIYKFSTTNEPSEISLTDFLKTYNGLEKELIKLANETTGISCGHMYNMIQSLRILSATKYISKDLFTKINKIRQYRNYLVHEDTNDSDINQNVFNDLKYVIEELGIKI